MQPDLQSILSQLAGTSSPTTTTSTKSSNPIVDVLTDRLTKQGKGIASSSSSALQASINDAINSTQTAGDKSSQALQSEREREVSFARDRAGATYTQALEGRSGYATQVAGLRELTETTEKSVRDLDKRYQEAILSNDAATASKISDLKIKKLEFLQKQEENYFNNLMGLANLQEQALSRAQQSEQFWQKSKQDAQQFVVGLLNSNVQFEKNYGLQLKEMGLKEQQLEIERSKYNLSVKEYSDRKKALEKEKDYTSTQAIVANQIKNDLINPETGKRRTRSELLSTNFMLKVKSETGFDGSTEELSGIINSAYDTVTSDSEFMGKYTGPQPEISNKEVASYRNSLNSMSNQERLDYFDNQNLTIQSADSFWSNLFK